jgi:structure-specific endonuclease subunit SLX1
MVANHPYTTWPLHVRFFTEEAERIWRECSASAASLPPGFSTTIEVEGVDGKSGKTGTGRTGPIDVTDSESVTTFNIHNGSLILIVGSFLHNGHSEEA